MRARVDARTFSALCGDTTRVTQQASSQRGRFSVVSKQGGLSQAETGAPLMTADQVRRLEPGELLAIVRHLPPVRLQQCRWYQDHDQKRRVDAA
ncbi:MAG: type IV secretory system conjugative DNA transfer family protein [Chloroflexota bacterium]|nr:type IV secretory system conjugative DNA transfer family protein [Chloroflexota bacterium]